MSSDETSLERVRELKSKLARTRLRTTLYLSPVGNVSGDLARLLGEHVLALMGMFYDHAVCRRANVAVTEFVTNVFSYASRPEDELRFDLSVDGDALRIEVSNRVDDDQYEDVAQRIAMINAAQDPKRLLRETINHRRALQLKGGLGLMRLATENKFSLSLRRDGTTMTICAEHQLESKWRS